MKCIVVVSGTIPDFRWLKWHKVPKKSTFVSKEEIKSKTTLISPIHYKTISEGEHHGVQMTVSNVTKNDIGMYTCCASNHIGMRCNSAFLTEKTAPTTQARNKCKQMSLAIFYYHFR